MKPHEIEALSFQIIDNEAGPHDYSDREWEVVRRMIHTSADFEFKNSVRFHRRAIDAGLAAIRSGCALFTDTNMARVGIRQMEIRRFGMETNCLIADGEVAKIAQRDGITRAQASVDVVVPRLEGCIYAVGNAPTALLRLIEIIKAGKASPALVIGLPVGFVNAAESKEALMELDTPYISNVGRKGGSNLAAAVVNALLKMAVKGEESLR